MQVLLFLSALLISFTTTLACKGCVSLDEYNFNKIITRFKAVLVKFDVAYPYGDKHDVFTKFADEISSNNDFILAEVGVKDYGERENEELAKKHGIKGKDDLPAVKLFLGSQDKVIDFTDKTFTIDTLRAFVRDNADMYIGLPGCIEEFDHLASEFVQTKNKEDKYKEIEELSQKRPQEEQLNIKTYLTIMKKIIENGVNFIKQEKSRLGKIIKDGKIVDKKKDELTQRLNILYSFRGQKDEL